MPIYDIESDGTRMVDLGVGDVFLSTAQVAGKPFADEIVFVQHPEPIGVNVIHTPSPYKGVPSDQCDARVRILFRSVPAIEALEAELSILKAQFRTEPEEESAATSETTPQEQGVETKGQPR